MQMSQPRPRKKRKRRTPPQDQGVPPAQSYAQRMRVWRTWMFLAIPLAVAAGLRIANLTAQSLWADEGNSVRVIERPLRLVIAAARGDIHPPGYYVLLWGWARLFGRSETAVRALSVVIGVALVGLVYLAARRWFGARSGWLAALCAAVSPFQVAYSQEVRMYILVAFLAMAATYAFARWVETGDERQRRLWGGIYVLAAAAGLWTHYSFPIIIAALNVAWLVWWMRRSPAWSSLAWWLLLHLAIVVLYLPWLPTAWAKVTGYGAISESHSLSFIVAEALKLLSVGESVANDDLTRWLTLGMVGLAVLGAWGGFSRRSPAENRRSVVRTLTLVLLALAPMTMMVALNLTGRPAYRPKFFLVASPAFCILVGHGIALLERSGGRRTMINQLWLLAGLVIVGFGAARSLRNYYFDPAYARADYRGMAAYIAGQERQGDAVLLDAPNQWEVFTYYYRGQAPVYPLCRSRPPQQEEVVAELEQIVSQHSRLFALYWAVQESDPERIVERWLEEHAFKASDTWYGDVRLVVYAVPQSGGTGQMAHALEDVRIGEAIALRGYTLTPEEVRPGDILQVTLFWEALDVPAGRYKVFVHLAGPDGRPLAQFDGEPGDGMNLTPNWRPENGVFADRYGILVPVSLEAGSYRLLVGMYDISGAPRLPISAAGTPLGDALTLATVQVR
jgi:mannosyltransferase